MFTFVQAGVGQGAFSTTATIALSSTVATGDVLIICIQSLLGQPIPTSVTDGAGNTYTAASGSPFNIQAGGSPGRFINFLVYTTIAGSTVGSLTVTVHGPGGMCVDCTALDYNPGTLFTQDQTTSIRSGLGSPLVETDALSSSTTASNELCLSIVSTDTNTQTLTVASPYVRRATANDASFNGTWAVAEKISTVSGTQPVTWTMTGAGTSGYANLMITWKTAAGAGGVKSSFFVVVS